MLEGLPLGKKVFEEIPREGREVLYGDSARVFLLWSVEAAWQGPSARARLCTTPGLYAKDKSASRVTDPMIRWFITRALEMSRRGSYTTGAGSFSS